MKPVYQTIFGSPSGNCLQACIASILNLPLSEVPNFMERPGDEWLQAMDEFLYKCGLQAVRIVPHDHFEAHGFHLISGPSPRGDYWHSIVGFDGSPVHDPYPDGKCELVSEETWTLFVALDPGAWTYDYTMDMKKGE